MKTPVFIDLLFILLVISLFTALVYGLGILLRRADMPRPGRKTSTIAFLILAWLGVQAILASNGFFSDFNAVPPRIALVVLPSLIAILLLAFKARHIIIQTPIKWIVGIQCFRILMEFILWLLYRHNIIPVQMTFEGRNFDILIGLSAPVMAYLSTRRNSRILLVIWNFLGLILLINIVIVANLSTPSPLRYFMNEPANTIIGYFPFIWLPGFVVPFAFAMHVFSLTKLMYKNERLPELNRIT